MILLRTTSFSPHTAAFAARLADDSGHELCFVVDERKGKVDVGPFRKISLTRKTCRAADLYCPFDVGWRCGDYGFYLARQRFPAERFFWLVEYDVRMSGADTGEFFAHFAAEDTDLIAAYYRKAEHWWYWRHTMEARGQDVWRCLFPVVRLSATAIDVLHQRRRAYARRLSRLANWPNDESFVATILTRAGMKCADLNDFGKKLYDETTYTFDKPLNGDEFNEHSPAVMLYHPVLYGEDLRRKIKFMTWVEKGESLPRKVKRHVIHALNRRMPA